MAEFPAGYWPPGYFPAGYTGPTPAPDAWSIMATLDFEVGAPLADLHAGTGILSDLSTQAVFVPVAAYQRTDDSPEDPTVNPAWVAFTSGRDPITSDWNAVTWFERTAGGTSRYLAAVLVGSGGVLALSPGSVTVWLKVADSGETLVYNAGTLTVR